MSDLPPVLASTPELRRLADRVVWFKSGDAALQDPAHLMLDRAETPLPRRFPGDIGGAPR